ncbi:MAG: aminoacyl-tRNA hydrolase, partial [Akkermansia sp.]|nr:aminoacyl-tRNA hydrolase [Akkermansia sp.]
FMVLDRLARRFGAEWKLDKARKGELAAGPGVLLIKPTTFMNLSGECVGPIMRYYKFEPEQVLVIYDDISFPVGTMKLRSSGSAGGHNGMKSLIAHLGCEKFPRIRVGIGAPGQKEMVGHVLGKFAPDERPLLEECLAKAEEATAMMMREGFQAAANKFNVKKEKKPRKKPEAPAEESAETTPEPQQTENA